MRLSDIEQLIKPMKMTKKKTGNSMKFSTLMRRLPSSWTRSQRFGLRLKKSLQKMLSSRSVMQLKPRS